MILLALLAGAIACNKGVEEPPPSAMASGPDCLPDITLTDMHGHKISLASLKRKPVLFDFFYTTCPGPCLMLTARMKRIADELGPMLGTRAWLVSVTVDPEHDRPQQLVDYTKEQGVADTKGWLFLTGTPQQIDQVMARFKLRRQREPDGSVDHVLASPWLARTGMNWFNTWPLTPIPLRSPATSNEWPTASRWCAAVIAARMADRLRSGSR